MELASEVLLMLLLCSCSVNGRDVIIEDDATLQSYLCYPTGGVVPPNTTFILNKPVLKFKTDNLSFCIVENTTDLSIMPSQRLLDNGLSYVTLVCDYWYAFSFFNITNLTIKSVLFGRCGAPIVIEVVRYINETKQFLYYMPNGSFIPKFPLIINHCANLKLHNISVAGAVSQFESLIVVDILIVNICGDSEIIAMVPDGEKDYPLVTMLVYYVDSKLMDSSTQNCNLSITANIMSYYCLTGHECYNDIIKKLGSNPQRMEIDRYADFSLYLLQQSFDVNVTCLIGPQNKSLLDKAFGYDQHPINAVIMFVNAVTNSHVSFQGLGLPYEICLHKSSFLPAYNISHKLIVLVVLFHETNSLRQESIKGNISNQITIRNTSFLGLHALGPDYYSSIAMLQVVKFAGNLSHEVTIENVSWCNNDLTSYSHPTEYSLHPFHAQNRVESIRHGQLFLTFKSIQIHHNQFSGDLGPHKSANCLLCLVNVMASMEGSSYLGENVGGTVISVVTSELTISGNITIKDGYAFEGAGIHLDSASTLFLKEPLVATFSDNKADRGAAIFAPMHSCSKDQSESAIQILPNNTLTLDNIADTNIKLFFDLVQNWLYAPQFSFAGHQTSKKISFNSSSWDGSQLAYTTLFSSMISNDQELKYHLLPNGICIYNQLIYFFREQKCNFIDWFYFNSRNQRPCSNQAVFSVTAYPGSLAFELEKNPSSHYVYDLGYCQVDDDTSSYKASSNWKTTEDDFKISFIFFISESFKENSFYLVSLTNTDTDMQSLPFAKVNLLPHCPIGFNLTSSGVCDCIDQFHQHGYSCNIVLQNFTSAIGYWTGLKTSCNYSTILFDDSCPPNYCKHLKAFIMQDLADISCLNNRSGILCGDCKSNFSAVFGSESCQHNCSNFYLLTLPVYALAGLTLVFALFCLQLTVANGAINGVIFYANVLGLIMDELTQEYIEHGNSTSRILMFIRCSISFINLNLGFPLCFYRGMTPAAKIGFQFLFPVYLWCIVIGLILIAKKSAKISKLVSTSSVQVLATLFYLSFSKILNTVIVIFTYSHISAVNYNGSSYDSSEEMVWYYNGMDYGHGIHISLLFLAVVFTLLFLVPYAVLVTFSHYFVRYRIINRFKPFIDAYSGPFKDKLRFWFGLRIWVTVVLFFVSGMLKGTSINKMLLFQIVLIMALILFQCFVRPFKKVYTGVIDTAFMLNFWLIIEIYISFHSIFIQAYIVLTFLWLLLLLLLILNKACGSKFKKYCVNKFQIHKHRYVAVNTSENETDDINSDVDLFKAAENRDFIADTY